MIAYNELCRTAGYEVIGDDDFYLVGNLDLEDKVAAHKKVRDGVKIEKDKSINLDDIV